MFIGYGHNGSNPYGGCMDEIRFSTVARSTDWMKATYNTQYQPQVFAVVGSEGSVAPSFIPAWGNTSNLIIGV
jgi:hypothetical protein